MDYSDFFFFGGWNRHAALSLHVTMKAHWSVWSVRISRRFCHEILCAGAECEDYNPKTSVNYTYCISIIPYCFYFLFCFICFSLILWAEYSDHGGWRPKSWSSSLAARSWSAEKVQWGIKQRWVPLLTAARLPHNLQPFKHVSAHCICFVFTWLVRTALSVLVFQGIYESP